MLSTLRELSSRHVEGDGKSIPAVVGKSGTSLSLGPAREGSGADSPSKWSKVKGVVLPSLNIAKKLEATKKRDDIRNYMFSEWSAIEGEAQSAYASWVLERCVGLLRQNLCFSAWHTV